jgi:hypothetical protein
MPVEAELGGIGEEGPELDEEGAEVRRRSRTERQRSFVPDGSGLVAVAEPAVAPVGGLGTGAEGLGDLSPGGAGGQGSGDGQLTFGREGTELSGEGVDASQGSRGHGKTVGRINGVITLC